MDFENSVRDIGLKMRAAESAWIKGLREKGVKAAHPDDGWVNRKENTIKFVYPQFFDNPQVGYLVALGWPWEKTRIVRLTEEVETGVYMKMNGFKFEEVPCPKS